ncbi:carbohydrate esterase family 9 protein [Obba rivulosa]|uniref:Carbohydrate esterase family 9 protein n=1 Tax=Obba rivulosa TaxID=1052685 RepID=A0A8E2AVI4_9APHY|nr:carbohydrate esterase family 9 protein [Obba rivulosa]
MEKATGLPAPVAGQPQSARKSTSRARWEHRRVYRPQLLSVILLTFGVLTYFTTFRHIYDAYYVEKHSRHTIQAATLARCRSLHETPGPPPDFHKRKQSDRFVPGTKPVLLKNAKIWTGVNNGTEVVHGDILLEKGLIKGVGHVSRSILAEYKDDLVTVDVKNAWVTPGIVDLHSHLGDASSPELDGASGDDNSLRGPIQPWLRSLDGLNTHDASYALSIAGGVTTALVLPGSANAIGGQGFTIKLRKTPERSPSSMLLEPPFQINTSFLETSGRPRWRQMKHACGENPSRVYGYTRMDTIWAFREAYDKARQTKEAQDDYCAKALDGKWHALKDAPYPEDLQWESLVDVLRGRVKVQVHCYETVDLDDIVRLTNEFQFPIAAFHHAHEAYLVPEVLKRAYGHPPAVAMFATNARYKRESYRGSEFAPRILAQHGLPVVMKSDHPVLDSRYLLYEAQQAYVYGLPENLAIAAVTSTPAAIMGMDHRVGYVKEGWDADLVVWDSHPLALGATPKQVFIDGIPQLETPHNVRKPSSFQVTPRVPNFDKEAADAVKYEGLPPLEPRNSTRGAVLFTNVKNVFKQTVSGVEEVYAAQDNELGVALAVDGSLRCIGTHGSCVPSAVAEGAEVVDTRGGSIAPGLVTFGSQLGLEEISSEASTRDGYVYDPLLQSVPSIVGGDKAVIHASDGLQYGTRDALLAYRAGVTTAITAPSHRRFYSGLSTSFSTGALHKLAEGAVVQDINALHVSVRHFGAPSISTQIAALRHLLLEPGENAEGNWFKDVGEGKLTLVVDADSADVIATLILLKKEVEEQFGSNVKMTIAGAVEAHILAKELAEADIGVIQVPSRPFPTTWERLRIMPGRPLSEQSSLALLLAHNVTVGIGIEEAWSARNTRFDIGWAAIDAGEDISRAQAIAMGSTNVEKLLGGRVEAEDLRDMVVTSGGDILDFESKVVAVVSSRRKIVDLL